MLHDFVAEGQHDTPRLENGQRKDRRTGGTYKEKTSYLMECLAYNVPNADLTGGVTRSQWFQRALATLFNSLLVSSYDPGQWLEPNELKYLFGGQKWNMNDARELADKFWGDLEYE